MTAEVLRDLARVKAVFQLRAVEAIIRGPRHAMSAFGQDRNGLEAKPASAVPAEQGDAQKPFQVTDSSGHSS